MMPWLRCCLMFALTLGLKVELGAQWSFEAGPGRLAVSIGEPQVAPRGGKGAAGSAGSRRRGQSVVLPATVPIYQGARMVGQGELLTWLPKAGMAELRALLPKGRFRLGTPRSREATGRQGQGDADRKSVARIQGASLDLAFEWREGGQFPRYRAEGVLPALELRADLYVYPGHGLELRLRCFAGQRHQEGERLQLRGRFPVAWAAGRELRLAGTALGADAGVGLVSRFLSLPGSEGGAMQAFTLSIPPGVLRPGDGIEIVLLALEGRDPEEKAIGADSLRKRLGHGPSRKKLRTSRRFQGRVDRDLATILASTGKLPLLHRGDHRRRPPGKEAPALWTHLEFDLPLGLYLLGSERRESRLLSAAWQGLQHLMGRDRSRPWRNGTLGYRLPVRHGARHGIGRVALGHVFLESALLVSALRCNRLLFEEALLSLDALVDLVPRSIRQAKQLRDLAWPLVNLELGLRLMDRRPWRKGAESLLAFLDQVFREGSFDLRESHLPGGGRSLDLWLVSGLLLPALDASVQRGSQKARSLERRLLKRIAGLPGARAGFASRYAQTVRGSWFASKVKVDPCYEMWLIEGLVGRKGMPASLSSRRRRLLSKLPGELWDPATRLAFLLRWPRLRAEVR